MQTCEILDFINILQENTEKFKSSPLPQLFLEVSIAKIASQNNGGSTSISESSSINSKKEIIPPAISNSSENAGGRTSKPAESIKKDEIAINDSDSENNDSVPAKKTKSASKKPSADIDLVISNWTEIIESLKSYNHSLSSVLKMSQPALIDGDYLILKTKYDFYKEKLVEMTNRLTIEKAIDKITGVALRLRPVTEKEISEEYPEFKEKKSLMQEAVDIFGGKIV